MGSQTRRGIVLPVATTNNHQQHRGGGGDDEHHRTFAATAPRTAVKRQFLLVLVFLFLIFSSLSACVKSFTVITRQQHTLAPRRSRRSGASRRLLVGVGAAHRVISSTEKLVLQDIGDCIGSGSYGTVHWLEVSDQRVVGKRAWTRDELLVLDPTKTNDELADKATRCRYYFRVEQHCLQKMGHHPGITTYLGSTEDKERRQWMLFASPVDSDCVSLDRLMAKDNNPSSSGRLLSHMALALGVQRDSESDQSAELVFLETLDTIMSQLLEVISFVHSHSIVHRDIKPSNLLVDNKHLVLIDFGSAADLETAGLLKENLGLGSRVAISPIYAAPEVFVDPADRRDAVKFDCFSVALLFCQFLFQYLEDRKESGFHQQLEDAEWDLDAWLKNVLQSKVRPAHLDEALEVLRQRPGLWRLLQDMIAEDPRDRLSSEKAFSRWQRILEGSNDDDQDDGVYLQEVLDTLEQCIVPDVQPLHFVATFRRRQPLGIILAESDSDTSDLALNELERWQKATCDAQPGEVFIQGVVSGGQAESMGIFEIGDRLHGIGEIPFLDGGFERAVRMLQDQPRSAKYVTLHFDRSAVVEIANDIIAADDSSLLNSPVRISDQGAWSIRGRRKAQEDAFLLHVVNDSRRGSILLMGVLDGHLGAAASHFVRDNFPVYFSSSLAVSEQGSPLTEALSQSWQECSDAYRATCQSDDQCAAEYDPREGTLLAYTGSENAVAGTTATIFALDQNVNLVTTLNCGDSRGVVLNDADSVRFSTRDHTPENEMERIVQGSDSGLPYSIPECKINKWTMAVGEYDYAVGRSLEGGFATSRGIISEPDLHQIRLETGDAIVLATDGLFEVVDSAEICREVGRHRRHGLAAGDVAKRLVSLAFERGSSDNISVVIVYLD